MESKSEQRRKEVLKEKLNDGDAIIKEAMASAKVKSITRKKQVVPVQKHYVMGVDLSQFPLHYALKVSIGYLFQPIILPIIAMTSWLLKKPIRIIEVPATKTQRVANEIEKVNKKLKKEGKETIPVK